MPDFELIRLKSRPSAGSSLDSGSWTALVGSSEPGVDGGSRWRRPSTELVNKGVIFFVRQKDLPAAEVVIRTRRGRPYLATVAGSSPARARGARASKPAVERDSGVSSTEVRTTVAGGSAAVPRVAVRRVTSCVR